MCAKMRAGCTGGFSRPCSTQAMGPRRRQPARSARANRRRSSRSVPRAHASDRLVPGLAQNALRALLLQRQCESAALRAAPKPSARREARGSPICARRGSPACQRRDNIAARSTQHSSGLPRRRRRRVAASLSTSGLSRRRRRRAPAMPRYYGGDGKPACPFFANKARTTS